jgi:hypothetical protein
MQFKLHSKLNCTKFKSCHIKWSSEVGFWLAWRWLLVHVKIYVAGLGTPDPCNLIRDCLCSHLFDPRSVSHSDVMIQIEIAHQNFQTWQRTPLHSTANIFLTSARPQMIEGILLVLPLYLKYFPVSKREKNGIGLITPLDHRKEAIPLQSVFNLAQL